MGNVEHPGGRPLALLIRFRFAVCVALVTAAGSLSYRASLDETMFARAGAHLLDGGWRGIYSSGWMQAGPVQLLATRLLLLGSTGSGPLTAVVFACDAALVVLAMTSCRGSGLEPMARGRRQLLAGVLAALWVTIGGLWSGHPAELAIPFLWMFGLRAAQAGRPIRGLVLIGLAGAVAPWAVLVLPALLGVARPARAVLLATGAAAVAAACYLPWVVAGTFGMFSHVWPVVAGSGPRLVDGSLTTFDWRLRLLQGVIVGAGTAAVALALRGRRDLVPVAAPLTTALLRVITDPLSYDYYWIPVATLALVALVRAPAEKSLLTVDARLLLIPYIALVAVNTHEKPVGALIVLILTTSLSVAAQTTHRGRRLSFGSILPIVWPWTSSRCRRSRLAIASVTEGCGNGDDAKRSTSRPSPGSPSSACSCGCTSDPTSPSAPSTTSVSS